MPPQNNFAVSLDGPGGSGFSPPSVGIDAGAQTSAMGRALERNASTVSAVLLDRQKEINQIAVLDAENKLREHERNLTNGEFGYTKALGRNAVVRDSQSTLPQEFDELYGGALDEIGAGLKNDAQRQAFERVAKNRRLAFGDRVSAHETEQTQTYKVETLATTLDSAIEDIRETGYDATAIAEKRAVIQGSVKALADIKGLDQTQTQLAYEKAISAATTGQILAAMDRDDSKTVEALWGAYSGDLTADDRRKIEKPIIALREDVSIADITKTVFNVLPASENAPEGGHAGALDQNSVIGFVVDVLEGGGKVVDNNDGGGTTKYGVTQNYNPGVDVKNITRADAIEIAKKKYWRSSLKGFSPELQAIGFDIIWINSEKNALRVLKEADGDPNKAIEGYRALLNKIADDNPKRYAKIRKGWMNRVDDLAAYVGAAQSGGGGNGGASAETAWKLAKGMLESRYPDGNPPPRALDKLRADVMAEFNLREKFQADREEGVMQQVTEKLVANGGKFSDLPAALRRQIPADKLPTVQNFAQSVANGNRDPGADDALYYKAVSDPAWFKSLTPSQFLQTFNGHPSFNSLAAFHAEGGSPGAKGGAASGGGAKKTNAGDLNREAVNGTTKRWFDRLGMDPTPKDEGEKARVGAIYSYVDKAVLGEQARRGGKMSDAETATFVDQLMSREVVTDVRRFGIKTGDQGSMPLIKVTYDQIPNATKQGIEGALRRQGVTPTEDKVLEVYLLRGGR
jgi:soluble lytic murein transglycosylase